MRALVVGSPKIENYSELSFYEDSDNVYSAIRKAMHSVCNQNIAMYSH